MTQGLKIAPICFLFCALGVLLLKKGAGQPGWLFDWHTDTPYLPWLLLLFACAAASSVFRSTSPTCCLP